MSSVRATAAVRDDRSRSSASQGCGTITAIDGSERAAGKGDEGVIGGEQQVSTALGRARAARINHVPAMTGGVAHAELRQFYATHFIPKMPPNTEANYRWEAQMACLDQVIAAVSHCGREPLTAE